MTRTTGRATFLRAVLLLLVIPRGSALAADYEVACSAPALVAAVTSANVAGGSIGLTAGCDYTFSASSGENSALPPIVRDITIEGRNARIVRSVPFAGEEFRHLKVRAGASLTLKDLTLAQGNAPRGSKGAEGSFTSSASPGGDGQHGGSIHNSGTVILDHVLIDGSRAGQGGEGGPCGSYAFVGRGGGRGGQGGDGGAVWNAGSLTIRNGSILRFNQAGAGGAGGRCSTGDAVDGGDGWQGGNGGAVFNAIGGSVTIEQATLFKNSAGNGGHGGDAPAAADGSDPHHGAGGHGGSGGGLATYGNLTVENSTIEGNLAGKGGSAISNATGSNKRGGNGGNGGGVAIQAGTLVIRRATINRNGGGNGGQSRRAHDLDGVSGGGGGVYANASASIENSTIADNEATPNGCVRGGDGGGLLVDTAATVDLRNAAVTGNNPGSFNCSGTDFLPGSIGGIVSRGTVRLWNSVLNAGVFYVGSSKLCSGNIIDSTPSANHYWNSIGYDYQGQPYSSGCPATISRNNPVYATIAASPDLVGRDPALGSEPARPGPASALVNAGQSSTCLTVDQRLVARPQGVACDIGPFESRLLVTTHPSSVSVNAPSGASFSAQVDTEGLGARVQWQTKTQIGDWTNTGSETAATLVAGGIYRASLTLSSTTAADNGRSFRAVFKNTAFPSGVATNPAILTVQYMAITSNLMSPPAVPVGSDFTLSFNYSANPAVGQILYEVSKDNGATWANAFVGTIPGSTSGPLSIGLTAIDEMYQATAAGRSWRYRATLSGGLAGRAPLVTSVATVTVNNDPAAPTVRVQALNVVPEGQQSLLLAIVSGNPSPTIGWQVSTDAGVNWTDLVSGVDHYTFQTALQSGNNQAPLYIEARADLDGNLYRPYVFNTTDPARRFGNPTTFRTRVRTTTTLSCHDQAYNVGTTVLCIAQVTTNPLFPPLRRAAGGAVRLRFSVGGSTVMNQACTLIGGACVFNESLGNFPVSTTVSAEAFYPAAVLDDITDQDSSSAPQSILVTDCVRPVITARPTVSTLHAPSGSCSAVVPDYTTQTTATAQNCAVTITQSPEPGSTLPIGMYTLVITATSAGGSTTQPEVLEVVDVDPPVFSFEGAPPLQVSCGSNVDLSATVTDGCDGTQTVQHSSGFFNPYENGVYTLVYRFADQSRNLVEASRLVEVTGAPVPAVTLAGPAEMSIACGAPFNDPGATATGQCGAPLQVTVTGAVNSGIAGTYILTYTAQGPSGELTATRTVTVTSCRAETTTTVASSANPSVYGQPVTLTAMVRSSVGTPSGSVFMTYDNLALPPQELANGDAAFVPPFPMSVGTHTLAVEFRETDQYLASATIPPFQQVVNKADTSITLVSSAVPAVFGQAITITPAVAIFAPGAGTLTGTLSISIDGGPAVVQSDLTAPFSANGLSVGDHTISVTYSGDGNFNGSTRDLTQTVNQAPSATTLVSSQNPSTTSDSVTFTATVSIPTPGAGAPTGNVTFRDGSTTLGIVALDGQFKAQITTTFVAGTRTITAEYGGNTNFLASTSTAISQIVTEANRAPTANGANVTTPEDVPLPITLTGSDPDGNALTFTVATQPANGTLSGTAPNLTYIPTANYSGADSFTFTVSDGTVSSNPATISITVTPGGTPDLSITKSDGGVTTVPGAVVSYTLTYANGGSAAAGGVVVTETIPLNARFTAASSTAGWLCAPDANSGSSCTFAIGTLAQGSGGSVTFAVAIDSPVAAGETQISNTATIGDDGANGVDPTPSNNSGTDTTPLVVAADLSLTKTLATSGPYVEGQQISYTINVANAGPYAASSIEVSDTPANLAITTVSGGGCAALPCTIASLASASNVTINVTATIVAAGAFDNSAAVIAAELDPVPANNTDASGNGGTAAAVADVSLEKTLVTAGPFSDGQSISYTLNIANAGPSTATTIQVTDTPSNLSITSVSGAGCTALPCAIASLASGANATINVTATIASAAAFDNSATTTATEFDPAPLNNTDATGNGGTAAGSADVSLIKALVTSAPFTVGQSVSYTLTIGNAGPSAATSIEVVDTPANLTITGVSGGGCAALPCTLASLGSGANVVISVAATINDAGAFDNSATANSAQPDPVSANNTDASGNGGIAAALADVSLVMALATPGPFRHGQTVSYTLLVANAGPSTATGIDVTDTPSNLTVTNVSGACAALPCVIAGLTAGANATVTVTATVNAPGAFDNSATALADETDPNLVNNTDNSGNNGVAAAAADVSMVKTLLTSAPFSVGQSVSYALVISNAGPSTATGVSVTDIPTNLVIADVSGACVTLPCAIASLPSGGNSTINVSATIVAEGAFDNAASVAANEVDPVLSNNSDSAANGGTVVPPDASADVSVAKTLVTVGPYSAGQSLTYTLGIANAGPSTATTIEVTDIPSNLTISNVTGGGCSALPCTIPSLASGENVVLNVTATIVAAGAFDNAASANASQPDPVPANNSDSTANGGSTAPSADVSLVKMLVTGGPYSAGQSIHYTLTIANAGPSTATGPQVTGASSNLISTSVSGGGCSALPCTIPSLASGSNVVLNVTARIVAAGAFDFSATATAVQPDPNSANNSDNRSDNGIALSSHDASIPTVNEWALMLIAAMLAAVGLLSLRQNG